MLSTAQHTAAAHDSDTLTAQLVRSTPCAHCACVCVFDQSCQPRNWSKPATENLLPLRVCACCLVPPAQTHAHTHAGMLLRWMMQQRGTSPPSSKQLDEEAAQPLLHASWERPENNKPQHANKTGGAGTGGGSSSGGDSVSDDGPVLQQGTVVELLRLSVPDTPVLLAAFVFGSAAALMAACVPYFTGLIVDYASIDPDRWGLLGKGLAGWQALIGFRVYP